MTTGEDADIVELLWQNYQDKAVSDLIVLDDSAPSEDVNNNFTRGEGKQNLPLASCNLTSDDVNSTFPAQNLPYNVDYLFGVLNKMQRSMETLNKRFMDVETVVFDLLDEKRCPLRNGIKAEKAVQTDTSIGCQEILNHLFKNNSDPTGADGLKPCTLFRINSDTMKSKIPEKFNFDYLSSMSENEDCKADKSFEQKNSLPESIENGLSKATATEQLPKFERDTQTPNDKSKENKHHSIWARDSNSDVSDDENYEKPVKKSPTIKDNIPDEMKSNASLPWHAVNKNWSDRHVELEAKLREVNNELSRHMLNRPTRVENMPNVNKLINNNNLGISPYNKLIAAEFPSSFTQSNANVNDQFFSKLQGDYMLPPYPRAQPNSYLTNASRYPLTRRSVYQHLSTGRNDHGNSATQRSNSSRAKTFLTGSNAIGQTKENDSIQNSQHSSQQYRSDSHTQLRHIRSQTQQRQLTNAQPSDDASRSHYSEPNRHHRRLLEAFKRNVTTDTSTGYLKNSNFNRANNKDGYTRRGTGIFTSEDEEGTF